MPMVKNWGVWATIAGITLGGHYALGTARWSHPLTASMEKASCSTCRINRSASGLETCLATDDGDDTPAMFAAYQVPAPPEEEAGLPPLPLPADGSEATALPEVAPRIASAHPKPTARNPARDAELRAVIEEVLPESSAEERSILLEQFGDLPAEVVRDILHVREEFRLTPQTRDSSRTANKNDGRNEVGIVPSPQELLPPAASAGGSPESGQLPPEMLQMYEVIEAMSPDIRTLRRAQSIHRQNVAQARTPGYRRLVPVLGEGSYHTIPTTRGSTVSEGRGVQLVGTEIDPSPGPIQQTDRPLDLSIQGRGWLVATDGTRTYLTRAGSLVVTADHHLAVRAGEQQHALSPTVTVPAFFEKILVAEDGHVSAVTKTGETPQECGEITLAIFSHEEHLQPAGGGLYVVTAQCGEQEVGTPGTGLRGHLIQGRLEQSNVDPGKELEEHTMLDQQIAVLRTALGDTMCRLPWMGDLGPEGLPNPIPGTNPGSSLNYRQP